jgi:polyribonucleotide nucleotidyltransferase
MASICGIACSDDAGVPIKAPVAGIAMGLSGRRHIAIYRYSGIEDHDGDRTLNCGTAKGVTALLWILK